MITAVDTSVLLDVFQDDEEFADASEAAIRTALTEGGLVACEVVWTEVCSYFDSTEGSRAAMRDVGVAFLAIDQDAAERAAILWGQYRSRGGTGDRLVADFLIGSHAGRHADRLLTRDRGFYRSYFEGLEIVDPSSGP